MSQTLHVTPRWGLAGELTKRVYGSVAKKLREPITNALDANAKNVWITITMKPEPELWITDDGDGMTLDEFKENYLGLGGSPKLPDHSKIGRIGVGFLAIMSLASKVEVFAKAGSAPAFWVLLHPAVLNRQDVRTKEFSEVVIGEVKEILSEDDYRLQDVTGSFTKIRLTGLAPELLASISSPQAIEGLKEDLSRILPLQYDVNSPAFDKLDDVVKYQLFTLAKEHSLNVFVNQVPLRRRLWGDKPGEDIRHMWQVQGQLQQGVKIWGYLVDAGSEIKDARWRGLTIRFKNVSVEESGFLQLSKIGSGWPRDLVTGELHVLGLDDVDSINLDRTGFNYLNKSVQVLQSLVERAVLDFFKFIRESKETLDLIRAQRKEARALQNTVSYALEEISRPLRLQPLSSLKATTPTKVIDIDVLRERVPAIEEVVLKQDSSRSVEAGESGETTDSGATVVLGKDVAVSVRRGEDGPRYSVVIDESLVEGRQQVNIDGVSFDVFFVNGNPDEVPAVIDVDHKQVRLNRRNPIISDSKSERLMFVLFLEYAYLKCQQDAQLLRDICLGLLYSQSKRTRPGRKPKYEL